MEEYRLATSRPDDPARCWIRPDGHAVPPEIVSDHLVRPDLTDNGCTRQPHNFLIS